MKKTRPVTIDVRNDRRHSDPTAWAVEQMMSGKKPAVVYKLAWVNPKPYTGRSQRAT